MIVKVLGYKISLELIILLLVIYLVMMVHALASCCNAGDISEGFSDMLNPKTDKYALKNKLKNKKLVENIII